MLDDCPLHSWTILKTIFFSMTNFPQRQPKPRHRSPRVVAPPKADCPTTAEQFYGEDDGLARRVVGVNHGGVGGNPFSHHGSVDSKKSPTGPTERTPKPENLLALATSLGVRW